MRVFQFALGLGLIVLMLAVETLVLIALAWLVLSVVRFLPLVGRKYRHSQWDPSPPPSNRAEGVAARTHAD